MSIVHITYSNFFVKSPLQINMHIIIYIHGKARFKMYFNYLCMFIYSCIFSLSLFSIFEFKCLHQTLIPCKIYDITFSITSSTLLLSPYISSYTAAEHIVPKNVYAINEVSDSIIYPTLIASLR